MQQSTNPFEGTSTEMVYWRVHQPQKGISDIKEPFSMVFLFYRNCFECMLFCSLLRGQRVRGSIQPKDAVQTVFADDTDDVEINLADSTVKE